MPDLDSTGSAASRLQRPREALHGDACSCDVNSRTSKPSDSAGITNRFVRETDAHSDDDHRPLAACGDRARWLRESGPRADADTTPVSPSDRQVDVSASTAGTARNGHRSALHHRPCARPDPGGKPALRRSAGALHRVRICRGRAAAGDGLGRSRSEQPQSPARAGDRDDDGTDPRAGALPHRALSP